LIRLEYGEIRKRFLLINSIRITFLSVLLVISVFFLLFQSRFPIIPFVIFILISLVISFFQFTISNIWSKKFLVYFQITIDIFIIAGLVYFSGGVTSPFYFLFFLPIVMSALFLSRRDTIYTAAFSYIVFGIISDLMYLEVIKSYPGPFDFKITNNEFIYNLTISFIAFSFFAIISSYYFENLRKKRKELRSVKENLKDLNLLNNMVIERMEEGLIVGNSKGSIISYNEKAKKLLLLKNNSNIFRIIGIKDLNSLKEKISKFNDRYQVELKKKDRILGVSVSFIKDIYAFKEVFVFMVVDLTNKTAIEEELKRKEHFALIGEMSAGLAHEIRNPLASISGSIQYLKKDLTLKKESRNLMNIIVKESARLSESIEEFLQFSKASPLNKEKFDLAGIVDEIIEISLLRHKNIFFKKRYSKGNKIYADREKINSVVWNVVNNSIKAIDKNGIIEISIFRVDSDVALSVSDNGSGINSDEIQKIFIPFYSKFSSGIGLGMAIVKRILDEHGFKIQIKSEAKKGTEVTIWFKVK